MVRLDADQLAAPHNAGGIGVTPFLSWIRAIDHEGPQEGGGARVLQLLDPDGNRVVLSGI